jgi:hypothetical protein
MWTPRRWRQPLAYTEENKALLLRFYEAFNKQNLAVVEELHVPAAAVVVGEAAWAHHVSRTLEGERAWKHGA